MKDKRDNNRNFHTLGVHAGEDVPFAHDPVTTPVYYSTTYAFSSAAEMRGFFTGEHPKLAEYGRYNNPTRTVLERKLAALEGAEASVTFASGMSAITTALFALLRSGDHLVMTSDIYRKTEEFSQRILKKFSITTSLVPPETDAILAAVTPETRVIFTECPTNPFMRFPDLQKISAFARERRIRTIVDATFLSPVYIRPLESGIDLVSHSLTKYIAGHNDVLGGVLSGNESLITAIREISGIIGGCMDAQSAYFVLRGLKTLNMRMERHSANAMAIATLLEKHPAVERVWYPGLASHPDHQQFLLNKSAGFGGMLTFRLKGSRSDVTDRFMDHLRIIRIAGSLGGVESLIEPPAVMSHFDVDPEVREKLGYTDTTLRLSLGVEDTEDLIEDIRNALDGVSAT